VLGVDLGLSHDTAAIVGSRQDELARLVVEACEIHRGTPKKPVSLMFIEDRIVTLAAQLGARRVNIDRWQAALLAERLSARGLIVRQVTSDAANLDRWATNLRRWFATRCIRIPQHAEFLEQLESLEGEEMRRRDRVRFTAHGSARDDAAVALCLSAMENAKTVGQLRMAEISSCARQDHGVDGGSCYLWGTGGIVYPDPVCGGCAANTSTRAAHAAYMARTGEYISMPQFVATGLIAPNNFAGHRRFKVRCQLI
jgi:hypothetical protein